MTFASYMLGAVALAVESAAVTWAGIVVSRRLVPSEDTLLRVVIFLTSVVLQVLLVAQLLGAMTLFRRWWVFAGQLLLAALLIGALQWKAGRHPMSSIADSGPTPAVDASPMGDGAQPRVLRLFVFGVGAALLTLEVTLSLTRRTLDFDTSNYHIPDAATWIQTGTIWHLPPVVAPFFDNAYPSNGELFSSWLMLPTHSILLGSLMPIPFGLLCILGTALLSRELGGRSLVGGLLAVAVVAAPLFYQSANSLLTDLPGAAGVLTALALLVRSRLVTNGKPLILLAGLAFGLSLGSKSTVVVFVPLILLSFPWLIKEYRLRAAFLFLVGIVLVSMVWFVRDWVHLGNPLFPETLSVAGFTIFRGTNSQFTIYKSSMARQFLNVNISVISTWTRKGASWLGPILPLSWIGVVRGFLRRERGRPVCCLAVMGLVATIAYVSTPYTGPDDFPGFVLENWRYDLIAMLIGVALLSLLAGRLVVLLAVAALAFDVYRMFRIDGRADLHPSHGDIILAVGIGLVTVAAFGWGHRLVDRLARPARSGPSVAYQAAALSALTIVSVSLVPYLQLGIPGPGLLERAVRASPHRPVLAVGVQYLGLLYGPSLENSVVTVGAGGVDHEVEFSDPAALDAAVVASPARVMVVGPYALTGQTWTPQANAWHADGSTPIGKGALGTIYIRR